MDTNASFSMERPLTSVPSFISKWTKATAIRGLLLEFFGTAYYTYGISCSRGDPVLIALALFTPILFFIDFSGAYFNPAITIVKVIKPNPKMPLFLGILYIAVRIFGALFSGLLSYCFFERIRFSIHFCLTTIIFMVSFRILRRNCRDVPLYNGDSYPNHRRNSFNRR